MSKKTTTLVIRNDTNIPLIRSDVKLLRGSWTCIPKGFFEIN